MDDDEFFDFVKKNYDGLFSIVRYFMNKSDLAEQSLQRGLLTLYRNRDLISPTTFLPAFLRSLFWEFARAAAFNGWFPVLSLEEVLKAVVRWAVSGLTSMELEILRDRLDPEQPADDDEAFRTAAAVAWRKVKRRLMFFEWLRERVSDQRVAEILFEALQP